MLDRTRAMGEVVDDLIADHNLAFLDSDVLVNGSLDSLFLEDFDIGLTIRDHERHPVNGGVIVAQERRPAAVRRFFARLHDIYRQHHSEASSWFGDQEALFDLLGRQNSSTLRSRMLHVEGCRIRLLPCDRYNFSPTASPAAIRTPLHDRLILHFKGQRKPLMERFWLAHLARRERPGLVTWLRSAGHLLRLHVASGLTSGQ